MLSQAGVGGSDDVTLWEIAAVVITILGAAAALQQLASWISGRRRQAAQARLLEAIADQYDADEEQRRLDDLKGLTEELKRQIETEIPRAARRNFLLEQQMHLVRSLESTYGELSSIEAELGASAATALNPKVRDAVEDRLAQAGTNRIAGESRWLRWALIVLAVTSILPFYVDANYYWGSLSNIFDFLVRSEDYHPVSVVARSTVLVLAGAGISIMILRTRRARVLVRSFGTDRVLRIGLSLALLGVLAFLSAALYAKREDDAAAEERSKDLPLYVLVDDPDAGSVPENMPYPQVEVRNPRVDFGRYYYDNAGTAKLLIPASLLSALGLALVFDALRGRH